jgi:methylmalonyl-CoA mutase N-terminal domain/subunit
MPIVGVNCHQIEEEELPMEIFEVPETFQIQAEKLDKIKKERSADGVRQALDDIARCCDDGGNLMEVIVDAVTSYVTVGEISRTMKDRHGTWNAPLF